MDDSTDVELSAACFRALGEPTRLRIVRELSSGSCCVCDLRARIDVPGPLLSHHLRVLRDAGIVTGSRRGRWVDYTLDAGRVHALVGVLASPLRGAER